GTSSLLQVYIPHLDAFAAITIGSRKALTLYSEAFNGQANMSNNFAVSLLCLVAAMLALLTMAPNGAEAIPLYIMDEMNKGRAEDMASKE
ncbi:hypothetical protein V5799_003076, partial [Amblyomma americanum]